MSSACLRVLLCVCLNVVVPWRRWQTSLCRHRGYKRENIRGGRCAWMDRCMHGKRTASSYEQWAHTPPSSNCVYSWNYQHFVETIMTPAVAAIVIIQLRIDLSISLCVSYYSVAEEVESQQRRQTQRGHPWERNSFLCLWAHEREPLSTC